MDALWAWLSTQYRLYMSQTLQTHLRSSNDRTNISRALHINIEGLSRHITSTHAISRSILTLLIRSDGCYAFFDLWGSRAAVEGTRRLTSILTLEWTLCELDCLRNTNATWYRRPKLILEAQMTFRSSNDRINISRALHIKIEGLSRHLTLNLNSSHSQRWMLRLLRSIR